MTRNEDISDTLKLLVTSQDNILSILTWRDIEGRTPRHIASTHNRTQGLKLLELVGPENRFVIAKQINNQGQSVLHVAATNLENISYILRAARFVNAARLSRTDDAACEKWTRTNNTV